MGGRRRLSRPFSRYGGVKAYLAGKSSFYWLGIAYALGVILSSVVDMVWFPRSGHRVHGW